MSKLRPVTVLLLAVGAALLADSNGVAAEPLRVMSFNIRYGSARDGENHWDKRHDLVAETIRDFDPDLLGTQETLRFQGSFLQQQFPEHTYVGWSRESNPDGEQCGLMFRTKRFELVDSGQFWLSETPDEKFSKSWDSSLPRVATWVRLRQNSDGAELLFLNTHFDHIGQVARLESAKLLRKFVESQPAELPVIITGDFNTAEKSEPYNELIASERLDDTRRKKHPIAEAEEGTFNGFRGTTDGARIDWILASPGYSVVSADIVRTNRDGRYPSDHFPVTALLQGSDRVAAVAPVRLQDFFCQRRNAAGERGFVRIVRTAASGPIWRREDGKVRSSAAAFFRPVRVSAGTRETCG
ncbi:MAG: endonuclease/exonuclease/phosphatase family protein [Planctomycetaceae bacterium]